MLSFFDLATRLRGLDKSKNIAPDGISSQKGAIRMEQDNDDLRNRFTAWMQLVVKRARIDYIRRLNRHSKEISIEDEQLTDKLIYEPIVGSEISTNGFEFSNERLSEVFRRLSPKRRQVLKLLFVHNMQPEDIAVELKCSLQHVYNLRSLAIKELKNKLYNGES